MEDGIVTMTNGAYPHYLTGYFKIYLKRLPERDFFGNYDES